MAFFDFFKRKKKNNTESGTTPVASSSHPVPVFPPPVKSPLAPAPPSPPAVAPIDPAISELKLALFKPYNAYLVKFISILSRGSYAPIAAYQTSSGEIKGTLFVSESDDYSPEMSVSETLNQLGQTLGGKLTAGEITSYILFYHSKMQFNQTLEPAEMDEELGTMTAALYQQSGEPEYFHFRYAGDEDNIHIGSIGQFAEAQMSELLSYPMVKGKDLFTEKIKIAQPSETLANGIEVKLTTNGQTSDLWSGLRGFTTNRADPSNQFMTEFAAFTLSQPPLLTEGYVAVHEYEDGPVSIRAIKYQENFLASFPVYDFGPIVEVKTSGIDEWENAGQLEAIVKTQGKETFQLYFYATDYASKKGIYRSTVSLKIRVSGVIYALDYRTEKPTEEGGMNYADDFAAFFPSGHAMEFGTYDFMSKIMKVEEVSLDQLGGIKGYILTFKMINKEDEPDFYTMQAFVNPENIRFAGPPKVGDKVSGAVQLLGEIFH